MKNNLTLEQVAKYPRPGMSGLRRVGFTPDSSKVAFLFSAQKTLVQQLWTYQIATGKQEQLTGSAAEATTGPLSREEELRRERSRVRELGVTDYQFAKLAPIQTLLIPMGGWLYLKKGDGPLTRLENSQGAQDPRFNPDGSKVAFVRNDELLVLDITSGEIKTLTSGAGGGITNGLAEYVAQEEMNRSEGFWWSPDGSKLAYIQADSRHIPHYTIMHQGIVKPEVEEHRYPFAGEPNAYLKLGLIPVEGGETLWLDLGQDPDIYIARVNWRSETAFTAQLLSRDQRSLRLLSFDTQKGMVTTLIEEHREPWLNLSDDLHFLQLGEILWSSEKDGFRHLYLHAASGKELRQLTSGDWIVTAVTGLDEARRVVYFQATKESVLERHLYAVSLDGGEVRKLTEAKGWHDTIISPDFAYFTDTFSNLERAPSVTLRKIDGTSVATLFENNEATAETLDLNPPELTSFQTRDGVTLYAAIYNPPEIEPNRRYPLIVAVYGGPHAQRVTNSWDLTVDLRPQYLAQQGFVVIKVDNRGSANRGLVFEAAIAGDMGNLEVQDQVDGVRFMAQRDYVDGSRVGIYGWSYGGYMTCMSLLRAPEVFKVGVAGAPVTHWDGYDTCYTERYMNLPVANPQGYQNSAVMAHVENLQGKLLLVHGMVDENVHFRHTARLIVALTAAQKPYDLLLYPEERHMPRDAKGLEYMERRIIQYFKENL